jgi:hypothetical protein
VRRRTLLAGASMGALGIAVVLGTGAPGGRAQRAAGTVARELAPAPQASATPRPMLRLAGGRDGSASSEGPRPSSRQGASPLEGRAADGTTVDRLLRSYTAAELEGFARFERLTGRTAPPELSALMEHRRAVAGEDALVAEATRAFAGDPLGRAAALDWLGATHGR